MPDAVNVTTGVTYDSLNAALTASGANDVIQVMGGQTYSENFSIISHSVTIESVGGLAYLSDPDIEDGGNSRAVLYVAPNSNANLTISGLYISGAVDANNNGAGVLFETGNGDLTINDCWFNGNQEGVLVGSATTSTNENVTITKSEFSDNGITPGDPGSGYAHNLYVNQANSLTISNSYFTDAVGGHEIKSGATVNVIENNRIQDGPSGQSSYSIDLEDGGTDTVSGNVIEKGPTALNKYLIAWGDQGTIDPGSSLVIANNTLIDNLGDAVVLDNYSGADTGTNIPTTIENNTLYGFGGPQSLWVDSNGPPYEVTSNNVFDPGPGPVLDTGFPCFAAGTRISTGQGSVAVEQLRAGDRVRTADGRLVAIRWIGHRRAHCAEHPHPHDVMPVRVRAGAFGSGLPVRDLRLSPDHAVFADGVLIPIRYLLNGASIVQESVASVTYYHVELAVHDVILAEGLPCESYLDTGNRAAFSNGGAAVQLHPDFALRLWEAKACAPLVLKGAQLVAVRRRLLAETAALGFAMTDDPALTAFARGRPLPAETDGRIWRVRLPAAAQRVRLLSRVWIPSQMRPDEEDARQLGVAIRRIWLDGREVSLESESLLSGWHAPEPELRWTDGSAALACAGVRELAFAIAMPATYWDDASGGASNPAIRSRP